MLKLSAQKRFGPQVLKNLGAMAPIPNAEKTPAGQVAPTIRSSFVGGGQHLGYKIYKMIVSMIKILN
ncbi:MAG: hypothetical protein JXR70_12005 [Spirochaetales bacterium]|nr:hypothetical protein [Spirochaetales bacterium]